MLMDYQSYWLLIVLSALGLLVFLLHLLIVMSIVVWLLLVVITTARWYLDLKTKND